MASDKPHIFICQRLRQVCNCSVKMTFQLSGYQRRTYLYSRTVCPLSSSKVESYSFKSNMNAAIELFPFLLILPVVWRRTQRSFRFNTVLHREAISIFNRNWNQFAMQNDSFHSLHSFWFSIFILRPFGDCVRASECRGWWFQISIASARKNLFSNRIDDNRQSQGRRRAGWAKVRSSLRPLQNDALVMMWHCVVKRRRQRQAVGFSVTCVHSICRCRWMRLDYKLFVISARFDSQSTVRQLSSTKYNSAAIAFHFNHGYSWFSFFFHFFSSSNLKEQTTTKREREKKVTSYRWLGIDSEHKQENEMHWFA